jgi:dihydroxyacetone kinase DhaKLM complex PTS-EIIA-like component DhaM
MGIGNGYIDIFHQITVTANLAFSTGLVDESQAQKMQHFQAAVRSNNQNHNAIVLFDSNSSHRPKNTS